MTTILRAESAHDFLALVPALAGYRPERSLVCVAFRGPRTVGVLRHDLPRRVRDRPALVEVIVGVLCKMSGVDGVVPIVYTDAVFGRRGMPERALLELLVARAGDAGFMVRDAFSVAADGWGLLPRAGDRVEPRPLALIEQSPASEHPAAQVGSSGVAELLEAAASDPDVALQIERALAEIDRLAHPSDVSESANGVPGGVEARADAADRDSADTILDRLGDLLDPIALGERIAAEDDARGGGASLGSDELAWFVHLASRPAIRDALMLQFAFGPIIGELALEAVPRGPADSAAPGSDGAEDAGEFGEAAPGPLEHDEDVDDLLARLLVGQTTVRPDPDRIERALGVLGVAVANAPGGLRSGVLCIAAWLAWALGRGSAAGALLDRVLADDPDHRMAGLLLSFIGSGALPEWAFSDPAVRGRQ